MKNFSRHVHNVLVLMTLVLLASCSSKESGVPRIDSSKESVAENNSCDPAAGKLECDSADLSKQSLDGLILAGGSFQLANFTYSSLKGTNFDGANLKFAKFDYADLSGANLSRTNLFGSSFQYAQLVGAKIQDVCLERTNFDFSDLTLADFSRSGGGNDMSATDSNLTESINWNYFLMCD
jgi:uncharacterized protein YjbI with pentapeptide repeats